MTDDLFARLADVVPEALALPPAERDAYLDRACTHADGAPDAALRAEAAALVAASDAADVSGALASPVRAFTPTTELPESVGPWRVTGLLGEGGMGVVYRAERMDGLFERTVALKRIRPELARSLAGRLDAERTALARLEHDGIARLYDGGVSDAGVPYLVMELAIGCAITEHAEQALLDVPARVRLLVAVCEAVAYAHARLVVHRDLKPSNVFVTPDGRPKLLDFGIAKILGGGADGTLAEAATRTHASMTPSYAAPEQLRRGDVTTASDVYALGVMLYELLAGQRPYSLAGASPAEAERIVCETVPPPPSTVAPPDRARDIRGDLDTICLKALAKEPGQRYASAEALAVDLQRHLDGRPVLARPATRRYRASRFVRRHRVGVAASALVVLALVGGAGVALWQARLARAERRTAERVSAFVTEMLASADPYGTGGRNVTVVQAADAAAKRAGRDLAGEPETEVGVRLALGDTYRGTGAYAAAEMQYRRALALALKTGGTDTPVAARALDALGGLLIDRSRYPEGDSLLTAALAIRRRTPGPGRADYATTLVHLGHAAYEADDLDRAERQLREAVGILARVPATPGLARVLTEGRYFLGVALADGGDYAASDSVLVPLVAAMRRDAPPSALLGGALSALAWNREYTGQPEQIRPLLLEALAFREQRFGPAHVETATALNDLAYYDQFYADDFPGAEAGFRRALAIARAAHGEDAAIVATLLTNLASVLNGQDRPREAAPLLTEAIARERVLLGPTHVDLSYPLINLGYTYVYLGEPARADAPLREALALRLRAHGPLHTRVGTALGALAFAARADGRLGDAVSLYRRAAETHARALAPDNVNVAEVEADLAGTLVARDGPGDAAEARRALAHARPILAASYPNGTDKSRQADVLAARLAADR